MSWWKGQCRPSHHGCPSLMRWLWAPVWGETTSSCALPRGRVLDGGVWHGLQGMCRPCFQDPPSHVPAASCHSVPPLAPLLQVLQCVIERGIPLVVDADGLWMVNSDPTLVKGEPPS